MRPSKLPSTEWIRPWLCLFGVSALLGGCAAMHDGFEATARLTGPSATVQDAPIEHARTDLKTVRPRGAPASAQTAMAAVPSPRDIFDFHPPGARPDAWRAPFDIDVTDGPLAGDVRRSQAELKAYNAERKTAAAVAARKPCSETDVATARSGCATKPVRQTSTVTRNPTTLQ